MLTRCIDTFQMARTLTTVIRKCTPLTRSLSRQELTTVSTLLISSVCLFFVKHSGNCQSGDSMLSALPDDLVNVSSIHADVDDEHSMAANTTYASRAHEKRRDALLNRRTQTFELKHVPNNNARPRVCYQIVLSSVVVGYRFFFDNLILITALYFTFFLLCFFLLRYHFWFS